MQLARLKIYGSKLVQNRFVVDVIAPWGLLIFQTSPRQRRTHFQRNFLLKSNNPNSGHTVVYNRFRMISFPASYFIHLRVFLSHLFTLCTIRKVHSCHHAIKWNHRVSSIAALYSIGWIELGRRCFLLSDSICTAICPFIITTSPRILHCNSHVIICILQLKLSFKSFRYYPPITSIKFFLYPCMSSWWWEIFNWKCCMYTHYYVVAVH